MARLPRLQIPDAFYLVAARAGHGLELFPDAAGRDEFAELMARAEARYCLAFPAYCLLPDRYFMVLYAELPNLSRAMQWLNGSYMARVNGRRGAAGSLFAGRYDSALVEPGEELAEAVACVNMLAYQEGLCSDPADYRWCSHRFYISADRGYGAIAEGPAPASGPAALSRGGAEFDACQYFRLCARFNGDGGVGGEEFARELLARGRRRFREELARKGRSRAASRSEAHGPAGDNVPTVPKTPPAPRREIDLDAARERVARAFGVHPSDLLYKRRNFPPRLALYHHLTEQLGVPGARAAAFMNVSPAAVTLGVRKLAELMDADEGLARTVAGLAAVPDD